MRGRTNRRGRSAHGPPFIMLELWILRSPAYQGLSTQARAVMIELVMTFNGVNNGTIGASARRLAQRCNIAKDTAAKSLRELETVGFVECTMKGAFSYKTKHASEWRLNWLRCDKTGKEASKLFMKNNQEQNAVPNKAHTVPTGGPMKSSALSGCSPQSECRDRHSST